MRAGERSVTAQINFDCGSEPPQRPFLTASKQKRRLGEVHLRADALHPRRVALTVEQANRRGVAAERLVGECVDLKKPHRLPVTGCRLPEGAPTGNRQLATGNSFQKPGTFGALP